MNESPRTTIGKSGAPQPLIDADPDGYEWACTLSSAAQRLLAEDVRVRGIGGCTLWHNRTGLGSIYLRRSS